MSKRRHFKVSLDGVPVREAIAPSEPQAEISTEPLITVDRFMGGKAGGIAFAFVRSEKLRYGIRKLTKTAWAWEYERFMTQPR